MIHVDEQFYLLAGQRITEGSLPYADFWDRKPVGLFLIYAAIRLLGGGVAPYQIVASLFAAATAYVVYLIARRGVATPAAFAAALIYCAMLAPLNGAGGQSPVLYNLFMACSALMVLRAADAEDVVAYRRRGTIAMLCAGLALQIKYVVVIEGVFFGLWLMQAGIRHRLHWSTMLKDAALFASVALAPTLAAAIWFAAEGALEPFVRANFVSIFQRGDAPAAFERDAFAHTMRMLFFALICTAGAMGVAWLRGPAKDRVFLLLWLVFACGGFLAIGNYYDHYALPLVLPIAVILSRLFAVRLAGPLLFALLLLQVTVYGLFRYPPKPASKAIVAAMTADLAPATTAGQCLFVADTPIILYLTTKACGPWRYSFPFHLIDATEAESGDTDQGGAMRTILDARPGAIVTGSPAFVPTVQRGNVALLERRLVAGYVVAGRHPDRDRTYTIWIRRDLVAKPRQAAAERQQAASKAMIPRPRPTRKSPFRAGDSAHLRGAP